MRTWFTTGALVAAALIAPAGAGAQEPDEQTQDHEEQDRLYEERRKQQQAQKTQDTAPAGSTQEELAAQFVARAEELIKDKNYWGGSSDLYMVETDDPDIDTKAVVGLLDSFRGFFDAFWEPRLPLSPYGGQSRVFLYDSFYKYNQLLGFDARRMPVRPEGHYISAYNVLALNTRASAPEGLADTVVHEAAHQLIDQRIYGGSGRGSPWVGEGLASYFGYTSRTKAGEFEPGHTGGKSISVWKNAPPASDNAIAQRLKSLHSSLKTAEAGWLEDVLSADPAQFYGADIQLNYTTAWLVVHYLLHAENGRYAEAFAKYIEGEVAGLAGAEALYQALGVGAADLENAIAAYAGKVKT
jgi:hypothetical protein